ncbi:hypothetical protein [Mycobacterium palustre]|nr:hypothetical protein [Mycobacterium palustre]
MKWLGPWWLWIFAFWFVVGAAFFVLSQPALFEPHFEIGQFR